MVLRVATWNVNSIKARLGIVKDWLEQHNPDVLLLQELKTADFPEMEFWPLNYKMAVVPQKAYNGVAILSRRPMEVLHDKLPGDDEDLQARFLEVRLENPTLHIICIYAPNGNPKDTPKFSYKIEWLKRLEKHLAGLLAQEIPFMVGGDFNIIPEDIDCYDPKAWLGDALFSTEARACYRRLINMGLVDGFRVQHQEAGHYSFWDYQAGAWPMDHGIRIDYFLLSPELIDRMESCSIDKKPRGLEKASDHTPVLISLG
ncbi:MAG: exodeoxyribonuclease III [Alphaproteobacteria bacterium]